MSGKRKIHFHINTGLTEEQTERLRSYIISYSVVVILWMFLVPRLFFSHNAFTTLVFYIFINPLALLVMCRLFAQDNEGESNLFLVVVLIEMLVCFLLSGLMFDRKDPLDLLSEYWWFLIVYFICGKLGMKLY